MKIGIFGGSFNPPHKMHENIVLSILKKGYVDKVICVPTGNYYKKPELIDIVYRINMLNMIFKSNKDITVSNISGNKDYEYTYQVLDYYQKSYKEAKLYFICGSDNLKEFKSWKNYEYIFKNYRVLIINRNRDSKESLLKAFSKYQNSIIFTDIGEVGLSSSLIRSSIKKGNYNTIESHLDKKVLDYIIENKLYRGDLDE